MISTQTDRKKVKDAISEISDSMTRIEAERELIKDIVNDIAENHEIPKKFVKALATVYHKQSYSTVEAEQEEFTLLYETLFELQK
jgi:hypothetical protein